MAQAPDFEWVRASPIAALVRSGASGSVVVVPGAVSDAEAWIPFGAALRTSLSVAIVNRRGRTPSDEMAPDTTVADEVEDLRGLLSRLTPPFFLVGWSYGGLLALEAAVGRQDVSSIVLYEPVCGPFVPDSVEPIMRAVERGDLNRALELVNTEIGGVPAEHVAILRTSPVWERLKPLVIPAAIELSNLNRHRPDFEGFARIDAPVTVIVGALNENKEPYGAAANRFIDHLPGISKVTLPDQGHLAHIEDPVQLAEPVDAALGPREADLAATQPAVSAPRKAAQVARPSATARPR